jgi:uncharacterized membrane protein
MGHGGGGCGPDDDEEELGTPTAATCPSTSGPAATYETFGRAFMETYCTRCHNSTKSGEERRGAPQYHDFDTLDGIRAVADHVDQMAGSGPNGTNTQMPPSGPMPSIEERQQLATWLACGAP